MEIDGPSPPSVFRDVSVAYVRIAGFAESMLTVRSVSAPDGSSVGIEAPVLSKMLNAKASGVPPLSTFAVRSSRNDRLVPGLNDSTKALKKSVAFSVTLLVRSPLAPPTVHGGPPGQPDPALPPEPNVKPLRTAVLLSGWLPWTSWKASENDPADEPGDTVKGVVFSVTSVIESALAAEAAPTLSARVAEMTTSAFRIRANNLPFAAEIVPLRNHAVRTYRIPDPASTRVL
jgi:hypothetical protein